MEEWVILSLMQYGFENHTTSDMLMLICRKQNWYFLFSVHFRKCNNLFFFSFQMLDILISYMAVNMHIVRQCLNIGIIVY